MFGLFATGGFVFLASFLELKFLYSPSVWSLELLRDAHSRILPVFEFPHEMNRVELASE